MYLVGMDTAASYYVLYTFTSAHVTMENINICIQISVWYVNVILTLDQTDFYSLTTSLFESWVQKLQNLCY